MTTAAYIDGPSGSRLAYRRDVGNPHLAGVLWLGGFMSDMTGIKAEALAGMARSDDRSYLRFDYTGHGASGGRFEEATISTWLEDTFLMFASLSEGPQVIAGSSMGGYLALLLMRRLQQARDPNLERIHGLVLVAPAVDMTEALLWQGFNADQRREVMTAGRLALPSAYGGEQIFTRLLIEDGRRHLLFAHGVDSHCPVRVLTGEEDVDVPWRHALAVYRAIRGDDVTLTLVKGGDHRLSAPRDLALITDTVRALGSRHSPRTKGSGSAGS